MKKLLILIAITFSSTLLAQMATTDWKVAEQDGVFEAQLIGSEDIKTELTVMSGEPKVLKIEKLSQDVIAVIYHAGVSGTSVLVESSYALLYNTKSKKFLGDFPLEYKVSGDAPYTFDQPVWKVEGNSLRIIDENSDIDAKIKL